MAEIETKTKLEKLARIEQGNRTRAKPLGIRFSEDLSNINFLDKVNIQDGLF